MTAGLGGLGYGEDAVAAKLSLDLPNDSEGILKHIAEYAGSIQTSMEATARYTGSYVQYLKSFPDIQRSVNDLQKEQLDILRNTQSVMDSMRASSGGAGFFNAGVGPMGQPTGYSEAGRTIPGAYYNQNGERLPPGYERHTPNAQWQNNSGYNQQQPAPGSYQEELQRQHQVLGRVNERAATGANGAPQVNPADINQLSRSFEPYFDALYRGLKEYLAKQDSDTADPNRISENSNRQGERREEEIDRARERRQRRQRPPNDPDSNPDNDGDGYPDLGGSLQRGIRSQSSGAASGINDLARIFTPGGSNAARVGALSRLIGRTGDPGNEDDHGSGLAGLLGRAAAANPGGAGGLLSSLPVWAKGAGIAGAVVAGGALAFNAVQNVGEGIQSLRNQDLRTHSLAGGLGVETDVRLMGLNPLITNEQSREIIMGALKTGSQGKSYDSAVGFIKDNLINMNIDVAKSVDLLKTNVDLGNQSIESLKFNLLNNQSLAQLGSATTEQIANQFGVLNNTAITGAGINAESASASASFASSVFNQAGPNGQPSPLGTPDSNGLSAWTRIVNAVLTNAAFTSRIRNKYVPNATPANTWDELAKQGPDAVNKGIYNLLQDLASKATSVDQFNAEMQVYGVYQAVGNASLMKTLYETLRDKKQTPIQDATNQQAELGTQEIGGVNALDLPTFEEYKKQDGNSGKTIEDYHHFLNDAGNGSGDIKGTLLGNIAKSNPKAVIVDPDGKAHIIDAGSKEQAVGLAKGTWKIVDSGMDINAERNDDGSLSTQGIVTSEGNTLPSPNLSWQEELDNLNLKDAPAITSGQGFSVPGAASSSGTAGTSGTGGACFLADTLILTPTGYTKIQDLREGDLVISEHGEISTIGSIDVVPKTTYFNINHEVKVTKEHPFYTDKGIKEVQDIYIGDMLITEWGKEKVFFIEEEESYTEFLVYNLIDVLPSHNYFANGFMVHNKGRGGGFDANGNWTDPNSSASGGSVNMGGKPGAGQGGSFALTPEAKKLLQWLPWPGSVPTDTNTNQANSGENGKTKNSNPSTLFQLFGG